MSSGLRAGVREPRLQPGVGMPALVLVMLAAFGISTAYGMLLLLPLHVERLGGDEANFGLVLSSAAIPAVLALVLLARYPEVLRPHWLLAGAIAAFGVGSTGAALVTGSWEPLVAVGMLLGTAWAAVYTIAPMVISAMVTDAGRATYFGYLTGSEQLGIGAGPVLAAALLETQLGLRGTFLIAGSICAAAVLASVGVGALTPRPRKAEGTLSGSGSTLALAEATRLIVRSPAVIWLGVIALFACLFSSMTQFQTTLAAAHDLDYAVFYIAYTIAVIAVRFGVAPRTSRFDTTVVIAVSVSVMTLAVASFLVVGNNQVAYAASSVVLGLGYGLALPAVQAHVVNVSPEALRTRVLPIAGLVFQAAILAFPVAVGWLVTSFGYWMLFTVLVALAALQAGIAWRQVLGSPSFATKQERGSSRRTHRPQPVNDATSNHPCS